MEEKFLEKFLKKHNLPEGTTSNSDLISELYPYDPSGNKKYLYWLYKRFVDEFGIRKIRFFDHEYWDKVGDALLKLENYPDRFKNAGFSTDISTYDSLDELLGKAEKAYQKSNKKTILKNDIDLVDEFNGIVILYPSTSEASCYYGRGTRWCVTDPSTYEDYIGNGDLFFILNKASTGDDYKSAIYVDALGKISGYDATDAPLKVIFSDTDIIEYDEYNSIITYPNRVKTSVDKYIDKIDVVKPNKVLALAFNSWVKSLGENYEAVVEDIDDHIFKLRKKNKRGVTTIGVYTIADDELLKDLEMDMNTHDIFSSTNKIRNMVKNIGEKTLLNYFALDGLFKDILMDESRFRFFKEYDIDNLSDEEIEKSPEISKLKKEFFSNPIKFFDENIYKGTAGQPPYYTNYKGLEGMLFFYDSFFDYDRFLRDYAEYCVDAKATPITWKYDGKKYYIMNINEDNVDINGK
jgi:hypothetical protein